MIWFLIIIFSIFFLIPFLVGLFGIMPPNKAAPDETSEKEEMAAIHKQERIELLDNTLILYIQLIDSLTAQIRNETNEKKRAALIAKQIITIEKYNKALEKRERIEND